MGCRALLAGSELTQNRTELMDPQVELVEIIRELMVGVREFHRSESVDLEIVST